MGMTSDGMIPLRSMGAVERDGEDDGLLRERTSYALGLVQSRIDTLCDGAVWSRANTKIRVRDAGLFRLRPQRLRLQLRTRSPHGSSAWMANADATVAEGPRLMAIAYVWTYSKVESDWPELSSTTITRDLSVADRHAARKNRPMAAPITRAPGRAQSPRRVGRCDETELSRRPRRRPRCTSSGPLLPKGIRLHVQTPDKGSAAVLYADSSISEARFTRGNESTRPRPLAWYKEAAAIHTHGLC